MSDRVTLTGHKVRVIGVPGHLIEVIKNGLVAAVKVRDDLGATVTVLVLLARDVLSKVERVVALTAGQNRSSPPGVNEVVATATIDMIGLLTAIEVVITRAAEDVILHVRTEYEVVAVCADEVVVLVRNTVNRS